MTLNLEEIERARDEADCLADDATVDAALDRMAEAITARLADRFTPHHPAVVRQLRDIVAAGQRAGIGVSVCGEMASDPLSVVLLMGLGYRCLSVGPPAIPLVKWVVRTVPVAVAEAAAAAALAADRPAEVGRALREAVKRYQPL